MYSCSIFEYFKENEIKLRYKFSDHSLGVVSVAMNKDVTRKTVLNYLYFVHFVSKKYLIIQLPLL